jgi:DNA adenine methylase
MFYSPLRYPGGKNKLSAFIAKLCVDNNINGQYVEPYSGGASVALFLLLEGFVEKIVLNDKDRAIYAFWHSVLNNTKKLCELIEGCELTMQEWRRQKEVQTNKGKADLLELGFSTFYLNRTNRSGILNAGAMGGVNQNGNYLMDCRLNKTELIKRIKQIASRKNDIRLYKKDAIKLIAKIQKEAINQNVVFYFDPPYYLKASTLYMNHYEDKSHKLVSDAIKNIETIKWIISYDNVPEIKKLYKECSKKEYSFKHTAYNSRVGKEILFFSPTLIQPDIKNWNPLDFKLKKGKEKTTIVYSKKVA